MCGRSWGLKPTSCGSKTLGERRARLGIGCPAGPDTPARRHPPPLEHRTCRRIPMSLPRTRRQRSRSSSCRGPARRNQALRGATCSGRRRGGRGRYVITHKLDVWVAQKCSDVESRIRDRVQMQQRQVETPRVGLDEVRRSAQGIADHIAELESQPRARCATINGHGGAPRAARESGRPDGTPWLCAGRGRASRRQTVSARCARQGPSNHRAGVPTLRSGRAQAALARAALAHASEIADHAMSNGSLAPSSSSSSSRVSVSSCGLSECSWFRGSLAGKRAKLNCDACTDAVTFLGTGTLVEVLALRRDERGEWADIALRGRRGALACKMLDPLSLA